MITGYLATVCKAGQGPACCRYITMGSDGWACAKIDPKLKAIIDTRQYAMKAKGDNCEGITDLNERSRGIDATANGVKFVRVPE